MEVLSPVTRLSGNEEGSPASLRSEGLHDTEVPGFLNFIGVCLFYNIVLVSGMQSDSSIQLHIHIR